VTYRRRVPAGTSGRARKRIASCHSFPRREGLAVPLHPGALPILSSWSRICTLKVYVDVRTRSIGIRGQCGIAVAEVTLKSSMISCSVLSALGLQLARGSLHIGDNPVRLYSRGRRPTAAIAALTSLPEVGFRPPVGIGWFLLFHCLFCCAPNPSASVVDTPR
jgi:hypothetical protein